MIEEMIQEQYGITVERVERIGTYPAFRTGNVIYSIVPLEELDQEELIERQKMSEHLISQGDRYVSSFVLANHQSYISEAEGKMFILLSNQYLEEPRDHLLGRKLAKFHQRARSISFSVKTCSRIGMWKGLWETRIDQLERVWNEKLQAQPVNAFEKLFIDTFPYYMAMGETAIQYLVDTEIDDSPTELDAGTICYDRFSKETWSGKYCIKNPFDWVFDHSSRDIAEWVREHYFSKPQTYQPQVRQFVGEYQSIAPLTPFTCRLLFARLMFPIHYFETIEAYYSSQSESRTHSLEEKLISYSNTTRYYEEFLRDFFESTGISAKRYQLPVVEWL